MIRPPSSGWQYGSLFNASRMWAIRMHQLPAFPMRGPAAVVVAVLFVLGPSVAEGQQQVDDRQRRAEHMQDVTKALLIVGGAFWTLHGVHEFESCAYLGNAQSDCAPARISTYKWGNVAALSGAAALLGWSATLRRHSVNVGAGQNRPGDHFTGESR